MENDLIYKLSLTQVPYIGYVHAKMLAQSFESAKAIFQAKRSVLEKIEGIGAVRAKSIKEFTAFSNAEKEIRFLDKYNIKALFLTDKEYPARLLNCYDPPTLLFFKGSASLNASRVIAIVGTRNNTDYGKSFTEQLVKGLVPYDVVITSGLAFGIDAIAHKACLKHNVPTIGVLGHGLDTIYPPGNSSLARQMLQSGGLLTEFRSGVPPDKHNFPSRNRVVAGISDATILVETGIKGGSMITGEIAYSYNRDVFAVPGRTVDSKSEGCNFLIKTNKAMMCTSPDDIINAMRWDDTVNKKIRKQTQLFPDLSPEERIIADHLRDLDSLSIDELNLRSGLNSSAVASALLRLEIDAIVESLPGKRYRLL